MGGGLIDHHTILRTSFVNDLGGERIGIFSLRSAPLALLSVLSPRAASTSCGKHVLTLFVHPSNAPLAADAGREECEIEPVHVVSIIRDAQ